MEPEIYHKTAQSEESHWWFVGRRRILNDILKSLALPDNAHILEVGCGTGGNLTLLARYGRVYGMELDATAREYALRRQVGPIHPGRLPAEIPFDGELFNLLVLTDVLEHVDQDDLSLRYLFNRLQSGGYLLLTVPAFQGLWSRHDDLHHHRRRYNRGRLRAILVDAGFEVLLLSYLNTWLFPVIAALRLYGKFLGKAKMDDLAMPPPKINQLLAGIFASEGKVIKLIRLPFGVSLLALARKPS
jgi:SAM-dependent methyltransferase